MQRWIALLLAATLTLAPQVRAQPAPRNDKASEAAARDDGEAGLSHFAAGRWAEAYEAFRRADARYHAPTLVLFMAHSKRQLGKLTEARDLYRKVADERVATPAPIQFHNAQSVAREEIERLDRRIPAVELTLTGAVRSDTHLAVDGASMPAASSQRIDLDPGDHVIEVRVGEAAPIQHAIKLREQIVIKVSIPLPKPPPATAAAPPPTREGSWIPGAVVTGAGAAGLGIGAVTGVLALIAANRIKATCHDDRCPSSQKDEGGRARALALGSTVGLTAGAVLSGGGVALLLVRPFGRAKATVAVMVGPGSIGMLGRF